MDYMCHHSNNYISLCNPCQMFHHRTVYRNDVLKIEIEIEIVFFGGLDETRYERTFPSSITEALASFWATFSIGAITFLCTITEVTFITFLFTICSCFREKNAKNCVWMFSLIGNWYSIPIVNYIFTLKSRCA